MARRPEKASKPNPKAKTIKTPKVSFCGPEPSVTIEKIENGFLIVKSGMKRGRWNTEKVFSPTNPISGK